jgi:hypothetical protein
MGAWGPGVFSDDTAADLREDYRKLIGDGLTGPEATDKLLKDWSPEGDPDLAPVFWLALALTQWKCGRLEDRVKQRALEVISDGSALRPWVGGKSESKRRSALGAAMRQLQSPQPPPKKIAKKVLHTCEWEPGELIAYHMESGDFIVFRILGLWSDAGGTYPDCELLDWRGPELPSGGLLNATPVRSYRKYGVGARSTLLPSRKRAIKDRFIRLNVKHTLTQDKPLEIGARILTMDKLDKQLEEYFDLR